MVSLFVVNFSEEEISTGGNSAVAAEFTPS